MRVNNRIRVPEVRVVADESEQLGVMSTYDAMKLAQERGLDLVEISPRAVPPVCRIMDYGKFKYEQAKKKQQARKHASTVEVKEIKFRPKTEGHDMDFKIKHVRRFLEEGNKVRLVIVFRGREITHPHTGLAVLNKVVEATNDISLVEFQPNMEGRRMVMVLGPKAGVVKRKPVAKPATTKPPKATPLKEPTISAEPPPESEDGSEDDDEDMRDDADIAAEEEAAEGNVSEDETPESN